MTETLARAGGGDARAISRRTGPDHAKSLPLPAVARRVGWPRSSRAVPRRLCHGARPHGVRLRPCDTRRLAYPPGDLLRLYLHGYLHRERSSCRFETECARNLAALRARAKWAYARKVPDFVVAHVHSTDYEPLIPGTDVPRSIEVAWLNRRLTPPGAVPSAQPYPLAGLDQPCNLRAPDYALRLK